MKAMILAAGEGRRMRPLTDTTPKPLLSVSGRPLIEHHILRLRAAGFTELVVNVSYLGEQLVSFLRDGSQWQVAITISVEPSPLETAGGIIQALPLLGGAPFLLVNSDIYTDYPFSQLADRRVQNAGAHIVLVPNPRHNPQGDFVLAESHVESIETNDPGSTSDRTSVVTTGAVTYSGIGVYAPALFASFSPEKIPLKPFLEGAIINKAVTGDLYRGNWEDVGTPERLAELNRRFPSGSASQ